jgi:hypothetical protein
MRRSEGLTITMAQGRSGHVAPAMQRGGLHRNQQAVLGGLTAVCLAVLVTLLATALLPQVGGGRLRTVVQGNSVTSEGSTSAWPGTISTAPGQPVRLTEPRAVTIKPGDLPAGTRVDSEGPASFRAGSGAVPPSWDILMHLDPAQAPGFSYVESLAVVYPTDRVAASAMTSMGAAEQANRASEQSVSLPMAARQTVWVEQNPGKADEVIVRVTWQSMNVVAQVSVYGQAGQARLDRALQLARLQQERISAPVPFREPS